MFPSDRGMGPTVAFLDLADDAAGRGVVLGRAKRGYE